MPAAGRVGDKAHCSADAHGCPGCAHGVIGPAVAGSQNVFINDRPALRIGDPGIHAACCGPNQWRAATGSNGVFINGIPAHRLGDMTNHCGGVGRLIEGSSNVFIGDIWSGGWGQPVSVAGSSKFASLSEQVKKGEFIPQYMPKVPVHLLDLLTELTFALVAGILTGLTALGFALFGAVMPAWVGPVIYAVVRIGFEIADHLSDGWVRSYFRNLWYRILNGWHCAGKADCASPSKRKPAWVAVEDDEYEPPPKGLTNVDISKHPWFHRLIGEFAPRIFQFADDLWPIAFETVLRHATINGKKYEIDSVISLIQSHGKVRLDLDPILAGREWRPPSPMEGVVYARAISLDDHAERVAIEYAMIRGASWPPGLISFHSTYEHLGDGESVKVLVKRQKGNWKYRIVGLETGGHGYRHWCPADADKITEGGGWPSNGIPIEIDETGQHPSVYVAAGSHLTAPSGGGMREAYNQKLKTSGGMVDIMPVDNGSPIPYILKTSDEDLIYLAVFGGTSWSGYGGYEARARLVNDKGIWVVKDYSDLLRSWG